MLILPVGVQAQFTFTANNGAITITGYTGPGGAVVIPSTINGLPVTQIGGHGLLHQVKPCRRHYSQQRYQYRKRRFWRVLSLTNVSFGDGVAVIGSLAFTDCHLLSGVTFPDNISSIGDAAFEACTSPTALVLGLI